MKKIAFIIQLNNKDKAGLYYATTSRVKYFIQNNPQFEVTVFNMASKTTRFLNIVKWFFKKKNDYYEYIDLDGVRCKQLYFKYGLLNLIKGRILKISKNNYLKKARRVSVLLKDYELLVAHYGNGPGELAYNLSKILNIPFSVTYHGSDIHTTPFNSLERYSFIKKMLFSSSANIFVSQELYKTSLRITQNKGFVVYNGIDFSIFSRMSEQDISKMRTKYGLENKVVGFIGNFLDVKNVMMLPNIFREIKKRIKYNISFIVIGSGKKEKLLKEKFKLYNLDVIMPGIIVREELSRFYNLMNVLLLPSKNEGLPLVLIEAMACGVNCVGTKTGGIKEILPIEYQIYQDDSFIMNFALRSVELINSDESKKYQNLDRFSLEKNAKREGEIYNKILNEHG